MKSENFVMVFVLLTGYLKQIDLRTHCKEDAEKRAKIIETFQKKLMFKSYCVI